MRSAATARDQLRQGVGVRPPESKPPSAPAWLRGSHSSRGPVHSARGADGRSAGSTAASESLQGPLSTHLHHLRRAPLSRSSYGGASGSGNDPHVAPPAVPGMAHAGVAQLGSHTSAGCAASGSGEVCLIGSVDESFAAALSNLMPGRTSASPGSCASAAVPAAPVRPSAVDRTGDDRRGAAFQALLSAADIAVQDSATQLALEEHRFAAAGALLRRTDSHAPACAPAACPLDAVLLQPVPEGGPACTPQAPAAPPPAAPHRGSLPCAQGRPPLPHAAGLVARRLALAVGLGTSAPPPYGQLFPAPVPWAPSGGPSAMAMQRALLAAVANAHRQYDSASNTTAHMGIAAAASSASGSAACWAGAEEPSRGGGAACGAAALSTASSVNSWSPEAMFAARAATSAAVAPLDPGDRSSCNFTRGGRAVPAASSRAAVTGWGAETGAQQRAFARGAAATRPGWAVKVCAEPGMVGADYPPQQGAAPAAPHVQCATGQFGYGALLPARWGGEPRAAPALPSFRGGIPAAAAPPAVRTPPCGTAPAAALLRHRLYGEPLQPTPLVTPPMQRAGSGGQAGQQEVRTPEPAAGDPHAAEPSATIASVGSCASAACSAGGGRAHATNRRLFD